MNALNRHKRSDAFKWVAVTLCILLLAVAVTAGITKGFKDWNPYGWFQTCEHVYGEDGKCEKCGEEKPAEKTDEKAAAVSALN